MIKVIACVCFASFDYTINVGFFHRGTFIIDGDGILRIMSVYDKLIGRGIDELLRSVEALRYADETEEEVPPDWSREVQCTYPISDY